MAESAFENEAWALRSLLASNIPPSDSQLDYIQSLIDEEEKKLEPIQREMKSLWKAMQAITIPYNEHLSRVSTYRTLISPIRRLPVEIVAEIFRYAVTFNANEYLPPINTKPLLLAHISSAWRAIALDTPDIWNNIIVSFTTKSGSGKAKNLATTFIDRCRGHGFKLYLTIPLSAHEMPNPFPDIILHQPTNIVHLDILVPRQFLKFLGDIPAGTFQSLVSIQIETLDPNFGSDPAQIHLLWPATTTAFETAPKLESVNVILPADYDVQNLRLPWKQLRELYLSMEDIHFSPVGVPAVLEECQNLAVCTIVLAEGDADNLTDAKIELKELENMRVLFHDPRTFHFLDKLVLPRLRSLHVQVLSNDSASLIPLRNLLDRSKMPLKRLSMISFQHNPYSAFINPEPALLDILRRIPTLASLTLILTNRVDEDFILGLTCVEGAQPILPNLQEVDWQVDGADEVSVLLERLIRSRGWDDKPQTTVDTDQRAPKVVKLSKVRFCTPDRVSSKWAEPLESFMLRGLDVELYTMTGLVGRQ